jgi:hypothetical protein
MKVLKEKKVQKKSRYGKTGTPLSIRMACVLDVINGLSRIEASEKYGVDPTSISRWKLIFANRNEIKEAMANKKAVNKAMSTHSVMLSQETSNLMEELATLKLQLLAKDKELHEVRQQLDISNTMIDVAEKLFHIEIKKKLGFKQ